MARKTYNTTLNGEKYRDVYSFIFFYGTQSFPGDGEKHNTDCSIQTLVQKVAEESHGEKEEEERKNEEEEEAEKEREQ